jgi:hypothetical protein
LTKGWLSALKQRELQWMRELSIHEELKASGVLSDAQGDGQLLSALSGDEHTLRQH